MVKRTFSAVLVTALVLPGCVVGSASAHNVETHVHRTLAASGITSLRIENVAGSISVQGWNKPTVDVQAIEYGSSQDALDRTRVTIARTGTEISVETRYDRGGSVFGNSGAEVDYAIRAPSSLALQIANVSGPTSIRAMDATIDATEVSGRLDADVGPVSGSRSVRLSAVSGAIVLRMARASNARVRAKALSGSVSVFFPADVRRGFVGNSTTGTVGTGSASVTISTVSGSITVEPS